MSYGYWYGELAAQDLSVTFNLKNEEAAMLSAAA